MKLRKYECQPHKFGWYCIRPLRHAGACAYFPEWWNLRHSLRKKLRGW